MPIVVGAPRSGTTLLRLMLDAHPELAIPPETGFLARVATLDSGGSDDDRRRALLDVITRYPPDAPAWPDFGIDKAQLEAAFAAIAPFSNAGGCRAFYRAYAARHGKHRAGDKTPLYCLHLEAIERLLPEAHFIHLIRDGRDVALSLRQTWFAPGRDIETLAGHWHACVTTARTQGARSARYLEVRFEDLVRDHEGALRHICEFVDLDFDARMLAYHERVPDRFTEHRERVGTDGRVIFTREARLRQQALTAHPPQTSRAGAWVRDMSADEQRRFEQVAGALLVELGYQP